MRELSWDQLVVEGEDLGGKTFYRIGGEAQYFSNVESNSEIEFLLNAAGEKNIPWRVMGSGTNLVIQSGVLEGLTLRLNRKSFNDISNEGSVFTVLERKIINHDFPFSSS